ncbi:hypothetical protein J7E38_21470 [Bacillus sp. ISL-35]|uniref:hypothetical protein n=1 Tax=Bacillus sp. ISL-35 TaxID=2819122 RepID=UPI001BE591BC|nr:hypothetical protein [Bacillus sp. ISL-35]MBT2681542.1 hypothetical protein [Bacillus sp. ISL-35]MBT2705651.1 hypothetical protein [Chryseobacterium sp. ISL-80]
MTYSGNISKNILWGIIFVSAFILPNLSWMIRVTITLAVVVITLHQVQLTISEKQLDYKIKFFKFMLYRKILMPEKIKKIKFGRIGWTTKNAVIKVNGGFNIGVAHFYSEQLIADLEEFALANHIEIQKTRDFLLLEKYYTNS